MEVLLEQAVLSSFSCHHTIRHPQREGTYVHRSEISENFFSEVWCWLCTLRASVEAKPPTWVKPSGKWNGKVKSVVAIKTYDPATGVVEVTSTARITFDQDAIDRAFCSVDSPQLHVQGSAHV